MKKVLSILSVLAMLASSASAAGYVLPPYQPGALTPSDWQPTYNVEGLYAIGEHDVPDAWGVRGSFCLYSAGDGAVLHQFSLNVAGEFGDDSTKFAGHKINEEMWTLPVTAGYDLNLGITDSVYLDLGAKAGWATGNYKAKVHGVEIVDEDFNGFTMGVGAGIKIMCSDRIYLKVGYEFNRTFISDDLGINANQHIITAGIGAQF